MKSIIVGTEQSFGNGLTAGDLKDGIQDLSAGAITLSRSDTDELAVLENNTAIFGSAFPKDVKLQFAQGSADGVLLSPVFNPYTLKWHKQAYTAAVAKVIEVGRATTGTPATWTLPDPADHVGEYAQIRIYDLSAAPGVTNNTVAVDYLIKQGDTAANVQTNLLTKLEKYKGTFYANVETNNDAANLGYKFTGIVGKDFTVVPELLLSGSNVKVATALVPGSGLARVLAEVEKNYASRKGFNQTYWLQNELYTAPFSIVSSTNYDVYTLVWDDPNFNYLAAGTDPMVQTMLVVVPTGNDATTTLITYQLNALLTAIDEATKGTATVKWNTTVG